MASDQGDSGGIVYHYTTTEGLKGIIENRCIWATNVNFLNDISEYHHGVEIIKGEVEKYKLGSEKPSTIIDPVVADWVAKGVIIGNVQHHLREIDYSRWTFATSFFDSRGASETAVATDAGDDLAQWRAYGRNGAAFSIGFDKNALERQISNRKFSATGLWVTAENCSYELGDKKAKVKRIIESLEPVLPTLIQDDLAGMWTELALESYFQAKLGRHPPEVFERAMNIIAQDRIFDAANDKFREVFPHFMGELMVQPALMKDHSFEGEKEWRLVTISFDPSKILMRASNSGLIPYVELPLSDLEDPTRLGAGLIRRIVVGPLGFASKRESDNAIFAQMLLQKNKLLLRSIERLDGVIIESSRIPFKGSHA